ncbi:MAG: acetate kinase [Candidatus Cyclonatronum sp.]|uniref:acetate/propionate family kinase n=1 Tax=Cyclonatronum sp. TaxID=3024185 RepID=UPI0025C6FEA2|nr:acetate kinase [Cyclonatronum sp.]MCC5934129.1 acetate kinase [Balneolales bacterium]MCH8486246.1 acetate kinase [Cyclonatronum sp.]
MLVLVINCGSSSVKYDLIHTETREGVCRGLVERIGAVTAIVKHEPADGKKTRETKIIQNHTEALKEILDYLLSPENKIIEAASDIKAVGHRVVHGSDMFKDSVLIDEDVMEAIEQAFDLAPLHNPPNLKGIQAAKEALPDIPHVAVFDTAFHHSLPAHAYLYGIPNRLYRRYKIRKYGFHGTSHYFVSRQYYKLILKDVKETKVISCHLGNGASICAIDGGKSVDTSMGFTPLSGLVMGTRSGDLDPSILFYLVEKEELPLSSVHALLNRHSGLLGLSGYAADMRDLVDEAQKGDRRCQQAIDVFCYKIKQYIGSYMASMNGCDAILFTAGIGENSALIRKKAVEGMDFLGVKLDEDRNEAVKPGELTRISTDDSKVAIYVVPTNEELVIAIDAAKIARASAQSPWI